jgi:dihydroneopterin aldolase
MHDGSGPVSDRIELRGLRLSALVGALPEERDRLQPIEVDLDVEADLAPSGRSDLLADTIDYGAVCAAVEAVAGAGHVTLLEHLADRLAVAVLAVDGRVDAVTVAVRKLRPPVPLQLDTSGVRIRRSR